MKAWSTGFDMLHLGRLFGLVAWQEVNLALKTCLVEALELA
jgi:hypothetical protein